MKFSISQSQVGKDRYFSVFGKRFATRAEAEAYGESHVAKAEALAGRELSPQELRNSNGIAVEDRPARERNEFRHYAQQERGYRMTAPESKSEADPHAIAWAEDALLKAKYGGKMSDVAAAEKQLAAARAGAPPDNPFMLPGDRLDRFGENVVVLRKHPTENLNRIIHEWAPDSVPPVIQHQLQEKQ